MTTSASTRVEERFVEVGPITARVLVGGTGDPLLFLHGATGLSWDPFLQGLAERHTVYAVEHPGGREQEDLTALPGVWELVLFHDELLDVLGIDTAAVVGHSFGGMVAAELAANSPRRVTDLVLIAPLGLWLDDHPVPDIAARPPAGLPELLLHDPDGELGRSLVPRADDPQALFEHSLRMAAVLHFIWPIPDKGLDRRIHRVRARTLLVWGDQDRYVDPAYADAFAARLTDARRAIVPGVGHLAHREDTPVVLAAVGRFLAHDG